jgi:uncharacterized tellurite resistance protein B-like protein
MSILKFLGLEKKESAADSDAIKTETVRKIVQSLDQMDPQHARYVASFAYLLSRVAHADLDISTEELKEMERLIRDIGGLSAEQSILVAQMAKTHSILFGSTENFLVTKEYNQMATRQQKLALIHCLYAIAAADHSISTVEDNEIRQIASELQLDHQDYTTIKAEYSQYLAVLKGD